MADTQDRKASNGNAGTPDTGAKTPPPAPTAGVVIEPPTTPEERVAALEAERNEIKDRMLRIAADFENWKKRARKEQVDAESRVRLDRKSTRLNSSHVKISYAVFCLKK